VCEDSHTGNGQTLVVCQYEKSGHNNESSERHTGKFCLFTQFDIWCVDSNNSIGIEVPNTTEKEVAAPTTSYNNEIESIDKEGEDLEEENNVIIETYDTDIEDNALLIRDSSSSEKWIHHSLSSLEVLVAIGLVRDWI